VPEAKVTSKGQVTIPKEVRQALCIDSGDRVQFFVRDDGVVELRLHTIDLKDLYGILEYTGEPITVEDMNDGIAKAVAVSFKKSVAE